LIIGHSFSGASDLPADRRRWTKLAGPPLPREHSARTIGNRLDSRCAPSTAPRRTILPPLRRRSRTAGRRQSKHRPAAGQALRAIVICLSAGGNDPPPPPPSSSTATSRRQPRRRSEFGRATSASLAVHLSVPWQILTRASSAAQSSDLSLLVGSPQVHRFRTRASAGQRAVRLWNCG